MDPFRCNSFHGSSLYGNHLNEYPAAICQVCADNYLLFFFKVGKVENKRRKNPKEAELCKGTHYASLRISDSFALNLLSVTLGPIYSWL